MTAFSARPGRAAGVALAVLLAAMPLAGASPAVAQDAPVTLIPPRTLTTPEPDASQGGKPAEVVVPGIKVDTLGEIDPNSVGLLDAGGGGFGVAMWKGTPRSLVAALLPAMPAVPHSAVARDLHRRLLLSAAESPVGNSPKDRPSLLAMRIDRLLAQGDMDAAQGLLRVLPQRLDESAIARARADVAFLTNDNAGACAAVGGQLGQQGTDFWRKAQVFCQLLAGDAVGAGIGAGLLQEQGVEDAPFFALQRTLAGEKGIDFSSLAGLDKVGPLHIAMMRAARVQLPPAVLASGSPAVLRTVALSPNADLDTRLEAAEQAEMHGALKTETLRQLYLSISFLPEELSDALSASEKLSGPRGRALLYHAARGQSDVSAQAKIIAGAFASARKHGRLPTTIRVLAPVLTGIEPRRNLAWFAVDAGSALYFMGAFDAAAQWVALAKAEPAPAGNRAKVESPQGSPGLPSDVALWPFAQLSALKPKLAEGNAPSLAAAGPGGIVTAPLVTVKSSEGFDEAAFERWWKAAEAFGAEVRAAKAARILALVDALGAQVGDEAWARLLAAPAPAPVAVTMPPSGLMAGLRRAAAGGRVGETVLIALTVLGTERPSVLDVRVLAPVVQALRLVGLDESARRLAVEAIFDDRA
ncbi:MAG: hypothetical protein AB7P12_12315 [Alphaproteobacteria bacterium]